MRPLERQPLNALPFNTRSLMKIASVRLGLLIPLLASFGVAARATVRESARDIPVAKEVDVVVVGGTTGAVTAAVAAAEAGAKVFLMAPRTYLGEDLCSTLQLWLEPGEVPATPLAKQLFTPPTRKLGESLADKFPNALPFQHAASLPSSPKHKDSNPPSKLRDGLFQKAESQSVQYDGDVVLTADLGSAKAVSEAAVVLFHGTGTDYNASEVRVSTSVDGKTWREHGAKKCEALETGPNLVKLPVGATVRHVRVAVKRAADAERLLLGELLVLGDRPAAGQTGGSGQGEVVDSLAPPLQIKRALDEALLAAKVDFLFGSYPTELLLDEAGKPCGVVMANRSGRQAVRAKVIIDATPRAAVARMAGARFQPYPAGEHVFKRIVVGGELRTGGRIVSGRKTGYTYRVGGSRNAKPLADVLEYTLRLPMKDGSFASFAAAEQMACDLTFHPEQMDASEVLFQVPPDGMKGVQSAGDFSGGAAALPIEACRPEGVSCLYVVGGCVDVSRSRADTLVRPLALMELGTRIGAAAAGEAKRGAAGDRSAKARVGVVAALREAAGARKHQGEVKEQLTWLRPVKGAGAQKAVASPERDLPVLGEFDVVVVGGGTGGAPAGIGAARAGARTLVLEYLHGLGGVGTFGLIGKYYHGYRGGFTAEVDKGVAGLKATNEMIGKVEWWRQANVRAGTTLWFGVLGGGAVVRDGVVVGAVVITPEGRGVVMARTVIDSTGNADVAAAAGASCYYTDGEEASVQGTGLPPRELGANYTNTDYTFADDTDVVDFWHHFILARQKFKNAYDLGQLVDTRERRRIVGDVTITPMDIILGRTWPDAVVYSKSNFDSHGFTVHPVFVAMPPDKKSLSVQVPLRALLPQKLDGILVTGLGVSAHRDAMPVIRMQPDVQNQGYACGYAAAMVARAGTTIRKVDMPALQHHLKEIGCLPEESFADKDLLTTPAERLSRAVADVTRGDDPTVDGVVRNREALAVIFAQPTEAVPLLEKAHAKAKGDEKLAYAHILAMLGNGAGGDTLMERIRAASDFDKGWNYRGMGQFGRSLSELDSYIVALSRTGHPRLVDVVLEKLDKLDASAEFSHHRACAMALEKAGDRKAAKALAALLRKPGMSGFATTDLETAQKQMRASPTDNVQRNESLRELVLARALYRCGDQDGLGEKILRQYAEDLRGHYARHAQAVLEGGRGGAAAKQDGKRL